MAVDLIIQGAADMLKGVASVSAGDLVIAVVIVAAVVIIWNWAKGLKS